MECSSTINKCFFTLRLVTNNLNSASVINKFSRRLPNIIIHHVRSKKKKLKFPHIACHEGSKMKSIIRLKITRQDFR